MKKTFLLLTTLCVFSIAHAYDFVSDSIYYNITSDSTVEVTYSTTSSPGSYSDTIYIPESVTDTSSNITYTVTKIGQSAFSNCINVDSVSLPNTVTFIDNGAFYYCLSLKSFVMPNSVTYMGQHVFSSCSALSSISLSNSLSSINYNDFYGVSSLTSITIPSSVTSIYSAEVFSKCSSLVAIDVDSANTKFSSEDGVLFNKAKTQLICCPAGKSGDYTVPSSVISLAQYAFQSCVLLTSVTLSSNLNVISSYALSYTNLTSITIPSTVSSISTNPFYQSYKLTSLEVDAANSKYCSIDGVIFNKDTTTLVTCIPSKAGAYTIPSTVSSIYKYAFNYCKYIDSIYMSNSNVTTVGSYAFYYCSNLKFVSFSDSLKNILSYAFRLCGKLQSITLPRSVTTIETSAFRYCSNLATFSVENSSPDSIALGTYVFSGLSSACVLNVPKGSKSLYEVADQWKDFASILEPTCPVINSSAPADTAVVGREYTYTVDASDENGDALTYSLTNAPDSMAIADNVITWIPSAGTTTSGEVTLTVSDGDSSVVQKFSLAVLNAPIISSTAVDTVMDGETYTYTVSASDADGDTLTYSLKNAPSSMTITGNVITWTPATGTTTSGQVVLTVSDGLYSTTEKLLITVKTVTVTKVDESAIETISVYPNPVESVVNIKAKTEIEDIQVVSTTGAIVFSEKVKDSEAQLNLGALQSGVYFLKLKTSNGLIIKQIIKQ